LKALVHHRRAVLLVFFSSAGGSIYYFTFSTFMQKYLVTTTGLTVRMANTVMTSVLFVLVLLQPAFGALSDRIGRRTSLICFTVSGFFAAAILLRAIAHAGDPYAAFVLVLAGATIGSFYYSIAGIVKAELFPPEVRALGVGLPFAAANALFGGTAEYVALQLRSMGRSSWYEWYVTAVLAVAFIAAISMPDTRKYGYLDGDGSLGAG
jgi:MFS family permease